jgi:hypothetical protein
MTNIQIFMAKLAHRAIVELISATMFLVVAVTVIIKTSS